jgi:hypothetical protein
MTLGEFVLGKNPLGEIEGEIEFGKTELNEIALGKMCIVVSFRRRLTLLSAEILAPLAVVEELAESTESLQIEREAVALAVHATDVARAARAASAAHAAKAAGHVRALEDSVSEYGSLPSLEMASKPGGEVVQRNSPYMGVQSNQ